MSRSRRASTDLSCSKRATIRSETRWVSRKGHALADEVVGHVGGEHGWVEGGAHAVGAGLHGGQHASGDLQAVAVGHVLPVLLQVFVIRAQQALERAMKPIICPSTRPLLPRSRLTRFFSGAHQRAAPQVDDLGSAHRDTCAMSIAPPLQRLDRESWGPPSAIEFHNRPSNPSSSAIMSRSMPNGFLASVLQPSGLRWRASRSRAVAPSAQHVLPPFPAISSHCPLMAPSLVHLPDGQTYTIQPVFGGLFFKNNELNIHPTPFPAGWTVAIHTEHGAANDPQLLAAVEGNAGDSHASQAHAHRYRLPTLQNDTIFISSISNPSSSEFKPHASPSRQIALMLWISLYWYFQQPEPAPYLDSERTMSAPAEARPKGEWRIRVKREGVFRSKNIVPRLERMGLLTSFDTSVGSGYDEERGWDHIP
ncbi:hypothetical protein NUW58_g9861 [Xylaria curta]|uniref:Uncharacterized protein n=1 Tax=Xylaria curta TaxID=42375 RepID=A0ACC1MT46_9PEZI|nr:hypothetical protein NUW58_g9861 [Xylaria curta]